MTIPSEALSVMETTGLRQLAPERLRFARQAGTVRLTIEAEACYFNVSVLRAFPLSDPTGPLSVRDNQGDEIGLVAALDDLDPASRALVAAELQRRYVLPVIQRVVDFTERFGTVEWEVETDRGLTRFTTRGLRDNVTQPTPWRYVLTDVDGNRYDIPDIRQLPAASQAAFLRQM